MAKIPKQELKEPDKLQVLFLKTLDFVKERRREFIIGATAFLVVVIAVTAWFFYRHYEEGQATALYNGAVGKLMRARVMGQETKAHIGAFEEVVKKHPGTHAAALARYRLGNLYLEAGETDKAMAAYRSYLQSSAGDDEITFLVHTGLVYCLEMKKDYKAALEEQEKALRLRAGKAFEGIGFSNMGRLHELMKDRPKALEYYRKALERVVDPNMKEFLQRKIASLA
ncbi:MAG TPA: tetratricopeptide repeat protein [Syntrophales bacterium]|nr:tetratricopeptide repeat protein [Syntrophales bacterium]HOM07065.1 tetratricopeptide repeat protein [Syntrophales bacterium]HON98898.1 tetratricopeptide repeat protein [Syntrophales bacterium]HPC00362.1 tetratricopeptide repeat protein [Syntrophales bacterium]HPQ06566.1 tetratricopeptide repeat protein [Syntrophales bacterium]